jgi:peptidylprolyl isomerase
MRTLTLTVLALALALSGCHKAKNKATVEAEPESSATASASATATADKKTADKPKKKQLPPPKDVAAPPANAEKTSSGLASIVLEPGTGTEKPTTNDQVKVHYTGWTADGEMFDSSVTRGRPASFGVTRVIKGWTEGLQLMTVGEKRRFWIPADLAYGETPKRPGAPAGQLTFDVELIEIIKPPETPEDVAAPPPTAKKTKSGLAYRVLKEGTGTEHPAENSRVSVHYTGWTTDGKMFDSSVTRGRPSSFALNRVVKGWTEGVQLMVEGEKTRFWIPPELGYGDKPTRPGAPSGMLVFDIELMKIISTPSATTGTKTAPTAAKTTTGAAKPAHPTAPKPTAAKPAAPAPKAVAPAPKPATPAPKAAEPAPKPAAPAAPKPAAPKPAPTPAAPQ